VLLSVCWIEQSPVVLLYTLPAYAGSSMSSVL
jgi:hypothetical protein